MFDIPFSIFFCSEIKKSPAVTRGLNEQLINPKFMETFLKVLYEKSKVDLIMKKNLEYEIKTTFKNASEWRN